MDNYLLLMLLIILVITIILYLIMKDLIKVIDLSSKITLFTGVFLVFLGYLIRYFILNNIGIINLNSATNIIVNKFLITSIYLVGISIFEQIIIKLFYRKRVI